ncbi:hypothetical protein [Anaerotignum sp.]|nr:hypothetical protein [Anaerotignum sp.]MBQ7759140.1 hypothetical protein [Anaerotignum sp.]
MASENENKMKRILDNTAMSAKMEGYDLTPKMREQCMDILSGTKSLKECITEIGIKYDENNSKEEG